MSQRWRTVGDCRLSDPGIEPKTSRTGSDVFNDYTNRPKNKAAVNLKTGRFDSLDSIKIFCDSLNEVHPNIRFTTEIQNNKCINFLDVLVDNSSTTVTTSTFRKPTNTGIYSK